MNVSADIASLGFKHASPFVDPSGLSDWLWGCRYRVEDIDAWDGTAAPGSREFLEKRGRVEEHEPVV